MRHRKVPILGALAATWLAALGAGHANALTITLNDVGANPMTSEQLAAFRAAADRWENIYNDPITVNINISFDDLDEGLLGSAGTTRTTHTFSSVRSAMLSDAVGTEAGAVSQLPISVIPLIDINGEREEDGITLSTANAKALGLGSTPDPRFPAVPPGVDLQITFSTDFEDSFDYDPEDGIDLNTTDFYAVALHEIGHGLGFFSVTDVQDGNGGFTLEPNTFDLWRFEETGAAHNLTAEPRLITAGDAEYYDSVRNNVTLSHGVNDIDSQCNTSSSRCQASHWSDDQGLLMDPTLAQNVTQEAEGLDIHALNYVGYDRPIFVICCIYPIPRWDIWWFWPFEEIPQIDNPWPQPPGPQPDPPPWANLGWLTQMDLGEIGLRTGVGFARFEESRQIDAQLVQPAEDFEGQMNLNPPGEPLFERGPTLYEMTFDSDEENGIPFSFAATCGELGCEYDPTIGEFGGYRIPGVIDALGDGEEDVDARVTLIIAADENVLPNPDQQNVFKLQEGAMDTTITVDDFEAFGLETPNDSDGDGVSDAQDNCTETANPDQRDSNGDGFGNACDADLNNDGIINVVDLGLLRLAFFSAGPDADFNGDGVVNVVDLGIMRLSFFGAPGPSGVAL